MAGRIPTAPSPTEINPDLSPADAAKIKKQADEIAKKMVADLFGPSRKERQEQGMEEFVQKRETLILVAGLVVAILVRAGVATFPYSGESKPPMYGDYEAQRHWMEITTALPAAQWYVNSTDNDLLYWGLDYPPLTAYHSWVLGKAGHSFVPECFALRSSRGHQSPQCRLFMRGSVILSDLLVYFPGTFCAVRCLASQAESRTVQTVAILGFWLLLPLVIIDHGHFQYNGVCLGLCLAAAGLVCTGWICCASVLFTAAMLFKQIALYYAPAFFFGILAHCLRRPCNPGVVCGRIVATGTFVLATAALLFLPWLATAKPVAAAAQVIHRMFPFSRGLYEDKVANVWCSMTILMDVRRIFPAGLLPMVSSIATLVALLPANVACCLRGVGGGSTGGAAPATFVIALFASAMSFFLFGFQVHEKAVLFPCIAVTLVPLALGPSRRPPWAWFAVGTFWLVSLFSMFPLFVKDNLQEAYAICVLCLIFLLEFFCDVHERLRTGFRLAVLFAFQLHSAHKVLTPPQRYPHLWTLLITSTCGLYFVACLVGATWWQLQMQGLFDKAHEAKAKKAD